MKRAVLGVAIAIVLTVPALAQSVRLIGEFRSWSAYSATEQTGPVCFALTRPTEITPQPDGFTEAYLYLTNRPSIGVRNELNLVAGYTFATDTEATATVSGQTFELFTDKAAAWLKTPSQNDALASALRAGSAVVVEGTTDVGIKVSQTFSLSGATAASRAIEGNCTG
jgi:hypothetical protein